MKRQKKLKNWTRLINSTIIIISTKGLFEKVRLGINENRKEQIVHENIVNTDQSQFLHDFVTDIVDYYRDNTIRLNIRLKILIILYVNITRLKNNDVDLEKSTPAETVLDDCHPVKRNN